MAAPSGRIPGITSRGSLPKLLAQAGHLDRGADESLNSATPGHGCQSFHLFGRTPAHPGCRQLCSVHAGQNGNSEQGGGSLRFARRFHCRRQHGRSAAGVNREHVHAQPRCGTHRSCHGVGNIVQLQIKKYREASPLKLGDQRVALGNVKLQADLEPSRRSLQLIHQGKCRTGIRKIQSDDQSLRRENRDVSVQGNGRKHDA